jgi:hypothetical protein
MSITVTSFFSGYNCAAFTLSDGSVRMIGEAGRDGAFGFYSRGTHSCCKITPNGVNVSSVGNKNFHGPPENFGHIVRCITIWGMTFAIDTTGRLYAWGTFGKKVWESLPFDRTFKDIICAKWGTVVFVQTNGENLIFNFRKDPSAEFMVLEENAKKFAPIASASYDSSGGYMMDASGNMLWFHDKNHEFRGDNKKAPKWVTSTVNGCMWASFSEGNLIYRDVKGVHVAFYDKGNQYRGISRIVEAVHNEPNSPVHNAIAAEDNFNTGHQSFLLSDYSIFSYAPQRYNWDKDSQGQSPVFSDGVKQFDSNFVLTNKGVVIPISNEAWSRTDMVLSAFPEWADNEDIVFEMCKISPRNLACASTRLRKDVEFSKRIAALGAHAFLHIDGMVRRNRELRSYKHLYRLSG